MGTCRAVFEIFGLDGYPAARHRHVGTRRKRQIALGAILAEELGPVAGERAALRLAVKDEGFEALVS